MKLFFIFYVLVFSIISGGVADYLDYKWSDYFSNYDLNIFEDYNKSGMVYLYHHGITDLNFICINK